MWRRQAFGWLLAAAGIAALPVTAGAQIERLTAQCQPLAGEAERLCLLVAQGVEVGRPRVGLALTGGNPVPGTASTLGFRLGRVPRASIGGRVSVIRVALPPLDAGTRSIEAVVPGLGLNGSVAVSQGLTLLPTVGGVGSLDLVAGAATVPIPSRRGLRSQSPGSFGAGARVGLLRESFTLPGVSVSAMYHWMGNLEYGDPELQTTPTFFGVDLSAWSVRGAVSKRILTLGATGGLGYDRYAGGVRFGVATPGPSQQQEFRFDVSDFRQSRRSVFVNLSWTTLILHLVGEAGWQSGGRTVPGLSPQDVRIDPESGALFGSLSARIAI